MQIAEGMIASFHYTLTNDAGEVIDSSAGRGPLTYLQGAGNIVPGLEDEMLGRRAGEAFDVVVAPKAGYGETNPMLVQVVPKSALQGVETLEIGMEFQAHSPQGPMSVAITRIDGDEVTVDGNHPLAGQTLHFAIEITEVRPASSEERAHGHGHGEGGRLH
jgi:FKBP-type peptidyl-prolyl cis-trans isomerase SlyD